MKKVADLGGKVVTLSGPDGFVHDPDGVTGEKWEFMLKLRSSGQDIVAPYADKFKGSTFHAGKRPWSVKVDVALPCATQNELDGNDAAELVKNGCICVAEGANMPSTPEAVEAFQKHGVMFAPGKAANAGGVAVSGLEMSQNSMRFNWSRDEVDAKLHTIMKSIYSASSDAAAAYGTESVLSYPDSRIALAHGQPTAGMQNPCEIPTTTPGFPALSGHDGIGRAPRGPSSHISESATLRSDE